ncbi:MAG: hypothetical protein IPK11_01870 [Ignavibacteria bacterium]|nr:hypothetical protein [Ignavibacteria bacterium]
MEHTEKKAENQTEKTDATKTGIIEHKKSLDSLASQKVDGETVQGGISVKFALGGAPIGGGGAATANAKVNIFKRNVLNSF